MQDIIVCKFGGSSVANAEQIKKVKNIIQDNNKRKYIIVSAPGKDATDAEKVTDHLFNIASDGEHFLSQNKKISPKESYDAVLGKFTRLINDLDISGDDILSGLKDDLQKDLPADKKTDFYASRGEHYNAKVISQYLEKCGLAVELSLPEDIGFIVSEDFGNAKVLPETYMNLKEHLKHENIALIPGYYGITKKKDIAVLSRGGSDLTGGEVAYSLNASVYENWTDTDGIYQVDPRVIKGAAVIPRLTYKEIRLLSSKGFNVFHFDAMISCKKMKIPINIRNTNNPTAPGTMIVSERVPEEIVVGIAKLDDIAYVYLEKDMIGDSIGLTYELLKIFKDFNIYTYHYPSDKDDIAIIVNQENLKGLEDELKEEITRIIKPDIIEMNYNMSIISPVGVGMKDHPGVIAQASTAMKENNLNIEIMDQGPAQISFHFGVQGYYADKALRTLYTAMLKK